MSNIFMMCFLEKDNQLLLTKSVRKPYQGLWNAPGGKVGTYESPVEACKREIQEDTGLEIDNVIFRGILTVTFKNRKGSDVLMLFHTKEFSGSISTFDEEEVAWVETEKIYSYNNTPESFTYLLPYILETDRTLTGKIIYNNKRMDIFDIRV